MSADLQLTSHELWVDGRQLTVTLTKPTTTSVRLTWTVPTATSAYNGVLVLLSDTPFTPENFPADGTRYTPSTNWAAPADQIGNAKVVGAYYGYFGDDLTIRTLDVSNVDPDTIYYASIHAASNVLQYYPLGVQSYPLESSRLEKNSDSFAGSIPHHSTPPTNPTHGEVYFDTTTSQVLIWNATSSVWLATSDKTVSVGPRPPVANNQLFFEIPSSKLKFFIGGMWVDCNSTNTRIKSGTGWIPLGTVGFAQTNPPTAGDVAWANKELRVYTLGQWLVASPQLFQFETAPGTWTTVKFSDPIADNVVAVAPTIGDFFYDTTARDLLVWNGDDWSKADTESEGTPTTDKLSIGTDGSYDERLHLIKILKGQMGWPQVCVELNEEHFNIAINNALQTFRQRADNAYSHRHVMMSLKRGQQVYYLNDPRLKTDKIVSVIKIHRLNMLGISNLSSDAALYVQPFITSLYNSQSGYDLVSIHLMHQLSEMYEKVFAGNLMFTWDEASRQLMILRNISNDERVLLEVVMERTEQELFNDRFCQQWLQGWAMAELKEILGLIRTKYSNLPGPNGGLTLNGDLLMSEARLDFEDLMRQLLDYEVGNGGVNFGNTAFLIG